MEALDLIVETIPGVPSISTIRLLSKEAILSKKKLGIVHMAALFE